MTLPQHLPPPPRLVNSHIGELLKARTTALVQYLDGSLDVLPDLDDPDVRESLPDSTVVLRYPGRAWALDHLNRAERRALAIQDDEARAKALNPRTLRAAAGRLATAELVVEHERMVLALTRPHRPAAPGQPAAYSPHDALHLTQQEINAWEDLLAHLQGPLIRP